MAIADILSQYIVVGPSYFRPKSLSNFLSQTPSQAVSVAEVYSASVDDKETLFCFLEHHEMVLFPRQKI